MAVPLDLASWYAALEERHLRDLTFPEVRRALQALSSLYVERRERIPAGSALEGRGKRAAFALFYGPLHLLAVRAVVEGLSLATPRPRRIVDLGCGTGVAGAAWALAAGGGPPIAGIDASGWAVAEARWTYRALSLDGTASRGDLLDARIGGAGEGVVTAYAVNELDDARRARLLERLLAAHAKGSRVLVVEPIARRPLSWWDVWRDAFAAAGGEERLWRVPADLPPRLRLLDEAAGLDHRELTARSLRLG